MTTSAPGFRSIDQLSGDKKPSAFFAALAEADQFCALEQDNIALTARVDELDEALTEEKQHSQALWAKLMRADQLLKRNGIEWEGLS